VFCLEFFLITKKKLPKTCPSFSVWLIRHGGEEKDTTKGTIRINVKPPHQIGHGLRGQEEGETQVTPFTKKQKGCVNINTAKKGPNGKHSKDLTPKSKPKPLG